MGIGIKIRKSTKESAGTQVIKSTKESAGTQVIISVYNRHMFFDDSRTLDRRRFPAYDADSIKELPVAVKGKLGQGGKIGELLLLGHGDLRWGAQMGDEWLDQKTLNKFISYMKPLKNCFTSDAVITFMHCWFGRKKNILKKIAIEVGVRVRGCTIPTHAGSLSFPDVHKSHEPASGLAIPPLESVNRITGYVVEFSPNGSESFYHADLTPVIGAPPI